MDTELDSISTLKERKIKILQQKNEERKSRLEKRKEMKNKDVVQEENMNGILAKFERLNVEINCILNQIEEVNVPKESLPELFDSYYCKLEEWQNVIALTSHVLKIYHKKHFQDKYNELNDKRVKLEQKLLPEKKFSFKLSQKDELENETGDECLVEKTNADEVDASVAAEKISKLLSFKIDDEFGFSDKENERLTLKYEQILSKDVVFRDLKKCSLYVEGGANTIHLIRLFHCRVLCGPVSTSVFVEDCHNCTFVVACQQLRVHSTVDTDFYLHVTSRGIIENSERIRFAPYSWKYDKLEKHFELTNIDKETNNWNLVNDFNWLSSSAPSPNWSIIEENDRIDRWD